MGTIQLTPIFERQPINMTCTKTQQFCSSVANPNEKQQQNESELQFHQTSLTFQNLYLKDNRTRFGIFISAFLLAALFALHPASEVWSWVAMQCVLLNVVHISNGNGP